MGRVVGLVEVVDSLPKRLTAPGRFRHSCCGLCRFRQLPIFDRVCAFWNLITVRSNTVYSKNHEHFHISLLSPSQKLPGNLCVKEKLRGTLNQFAHIGRVDRLSLGQNGNAESSMIISKSIRMCTVEQFSSGK
jgi:hypothetical protein